MSPSESSARGDSNWLAGTDEGANTRTSSGRPSQASMNQCTPSAPSAFASSCGSQTMVVVPRATSTRASSPTASLHDSTCMCASMKPGAERAAAPVDALATLVGAHAGEAPVRDRDVAFEPLARERAEDPRALDHDVRLRLAARDGEQAGGRRRVTHARPRSSRSPPRAAGRAARRCARGRPRSSRPRSRSRLRPSAARSPRSGSGPRSSRASSTSTDAAVLQPVHRRECVGVGADRSAQRDQIGDGGIERLRQAAVDEAGGQGDVRHCLRGVRQRLAAAQAGRAVIGQRPREPDRLAALGRGERSGAALLCRCHRLAEDEVDALGLLGDDAAIDAERLLEGDREGRVVAPEERGQAAGDQHALALVGARTRGFGKVDRALLERLEHLRLALAREALRGGGVGVDRDHPRACADELGVQVAHEIRLLEQDPARPERGRRRLRAAQQLLPHAAVGEHDLAHVRMLSPLTGMRHGFGTVARTHRGQARNVRA